MDCQKLGDYRDALLNRIEKSLESCKDENLKIDGKLKLIKLLEAEKSFLNKKLNYDEKDLNSTNYHYLGDLQASLNLVPNIDAVLKAFRIEGGTRVRVDVVAEEGLTWVKVVSKHTKALHSMADGTCSSGRKSLSEQIKELKKAADCNKCKFRVPRISVFFFHDIPPELLSEINCLNVEINRVVNGEIKNIHPYNPQDSKQIENDLISAKESEEMLDSLCHIEQCVCKDHLKRAMSQHTHNLTGVPDVNLDISTMIALVSNQCHGHNRFRFRDDYLSLQAEEERSESALFDILKFLYCKKLHACKTAIQSFEKIVASIAGENEKRRVLKLISVLIREEDQISEKSENLPTTSKINARGKIIFGTGDSLKAVTCTSNVGFVRAARQAGVEFHIFAHKPRSLSEQKEVIAAN